MRTDRLKTEFGVELRWSVFPLHPETPEEGSELTELLGISAEQLSTMQARMRERAAAEGLPLGERSRTYNSRGAQELGKWAQSLELGDPWRRAVYRAFFLEARNIALPDELARIAQEVGLDPDQARRVLAKGAYAAAVDADWRRARDLGVNAVPTHICGRRKLVGFAEYPDFVRLIQG